MLARADTDDCPRPRRGVMPGWTVVFVSAPPKRLRSPVVLNSGARRTFQIKSRRLRCYSGAESETTELRTVNRRYHYP